MEISLENFNRLAKHHELMVKLIDQHRRGVYVSTTEKAELKQVYENLTNNRICGSCSNNWMKRLAKWYFESDHSITETKQYDDAPIVNVEFTKTSEQSNKPKRGRPKKI